MTVVHHLRGYVRQIGCPGLDFEIAPAMLPEVWEILPKTPVEAGPSEPRELTRIQTIFLSEVLGLTVDLERFNYFMEEEEN